MCEVFPVIWNVGFRKNITRVINAVFKKKDNPEAQEPLHFVRPNAKWSESPEPVVLINPDTGEEFVDFPEETIPERIRKVLDSFLVIERTSDIDVLFSRYDMILDTLDELKKYERMGFKFDFSPAELYSMMKFSLSDLFEVVVENSYIKQLEKLLSLKTQKGKEKSIQKWKDSFSNERITNSMMGDVILRFDKMKSIIKKSNDEV
jgi:hypothetical protein